MEDRLEKYKSYIATLANHVNQRIVMSILDRNFYQDEPQKFFYSLLFKVNNGLDAANLLILNIFNKRLFSDSLFLILRTLLSDVITFHYILGKSKGDDTKLNEYIENVYYDHIKFMMNGVDVFQMLYREPKAMVDEKKKEIINSRPQFFDSSGNVKPHLKGLKSIRSMVKEIAGETDKTHSLDYLILAYEHYDIFSKYEHLGDLTFHLIHRNLEDDQKKRILSEIYYSVNVIIHYQKTMILPFFGKETEEYKVFNDLKVKIEKSDLIG